MQGGACTVSPESKIQQFLGASAFFQIGTISPVCLSRVAVPERHRTLRGVPNKIVSESIGGSHIPRYAAAPKEAPIKIRKKKTAS